MRQEETDHQSDERPAADRVGQQASHARSTAGVKI
jgi:hypothetical protein